MCVKQAASTRPSLQCALESRNWKAVDRILSSLPSRLPNASSGPATITKSLEEVRAAADSLVQACDFGTAFESVFTTRKALIDIPSVLTWATESLKGFSFEERIIGRIATMLGLLGMGSDGRAAVGCAGAVDQLTILWNSHPTSVDIVRALVSLCSGHIDNVSRTMRRRGISLAVSVLSDDNNKQDVSLMEQTLVYIGLCAICTPDTTREENSVVPALLAVLEDDLNLRRPQILRHVLMALGNIVDCWTKEGFGYHLGDEARLVDAILKAWGSLKRSKDIAASSSWALGSMLLGKGTPRKALQSRLGEVKALAESWKMTFKTCALLYETADQVTQKEDTQANKRRNQTTNVVAFNDGSSIMTSSSHEICEDSYLNANVNASLSHSKKKRERGRTGGPPTSRMAEKLTDDSSFVRRSVFEKTCETDPIDSPSCDDDPAVPHADSCNTKSQAGKSRKRRNIPSDKIIVTNTPIRKSKRQRTLSAKRLSADIGRNSNSSRRARRIPIEVIEISSDSDDEPLRRSPKAVQDICT